MKNLIVIMILSQEISLYSSGDNFPFGMNHSVYEELHLLPEDIEYKEKYKISMDLTAAAGIKWWRAQGAFRWCDVQPDKNNSSYWNFDTEDSLVKWAGERGLHLLPSIGYTAGWARNSCTGSLGWEYRYRYPPEPLKWYAYKKYVDTLVERYDGDDTADMPGLNSLIPIKHWECMNEPYGEYFLGTPGQYVEMYESTRVTLKKADPTSNIVGPCMTTRNDSFKWEYFDTADRSLKTSNFGYTSWQDATRSLIIDSIDLDHIDVVSHHLYWSATDFMKYIVDLRNIIGEEKPIWITETGFQNTDPVRAERGLDKYCHPTEFATYSSGSGEIFRDSVLAMWAWSEPCTKRIDTLLNIGDTVVLYNRKQNANDIIIYNGGSLVYRNQHTALAIGDTLTIFDCWAEEIGSTHNPIGQAAKYNELLDRIINTPGFLKNLKVFFFCADNTIHNVYFPPIIEFGIPPGDTISKPPAYVRQRLPDVCSVIDTNDNPYPAYYIIKSYMQALDTKR